MNDHPIHIPHRRELLMRLRFVAWLAVLFVCTTASLAATPEQIEEMKKEGAKQYKDLIRELEFTTEARRADYQAAKKGVIDPSLKGGLGYDYAEKTGYKFRTAKIKDEFCDTLLDKFQKQKDELDQAKKKGWLPPRLTLAKLQMGKIGTLCGDDGKPLRFRYLTEIGKDGALMQIGEELLWIACTKDDLKEVDNPANKDEKLYILKEPVIEVVEKRMITLNNDPKQPFYVKPFKLPE
jgi:hypothetical protein